MLIPQTSPMTAQDYKRRMAMALMMQGTNAEPIQHWAQGLAKLGQGAIGGYEMYQADQQDKNDDIGKSAALAKLLQGGGAAPVSPAATGTTPPAAAPSNVPTKVYSQDEINPIDAPQGADRDKVVRTLLAEAGNQGPTGMNAVASVIRNRAVNGGYGGDNPGNVVTAPNQFEPWNTEAGRAKMAAIPTDSPQYKAASNAVDSAYFGNDPTNGATNFYSPKTQAALGREAPAWGRGPGQDIGDHRFFGSPAQPASPPAPYQVAGQPTAAPQATPQATAQALAPQQGTADPRIIGLLNSPNKQERQLGQALAEQTIAKQFAPETTDEIKEYNFDQKNGGEFFKWKAGLKKAGAQNISVPIDMRPEMAFENKAGQLQAERFNDLVGEGQQAKQMVSDIQTLTDLGNKIKTGKSAEFKAAIGPYAKNLGIPVEGLDDIQAFEAVVNRVGPTLRVKGSGSQSDYELKNFLKALPSLGNTPEGNQLAATIMTGLQENKIKAAEIGSMALNKEITRSEAEKRLRELPDPMTPYREYVKANKGAATTGNKTKSGVSWSVE